jgi:tRNA (guanine37-N1)-methyltransferase
MRFDILTLFPGIFEGPFRESIVGRAIEAGLVIVAIHNLRHYGLGKHRVTDDAPYGGGGGMVMKPEPIFEAVEAVLGPDRPSTLVVLLTPQGRLFTQEMAWDFAARERMLLICGRYEGVDERVCQHLVDEEVSIGDYVLTGGEIPATVIVDAVVRLLPGVLGDPGAARKDSYAEGLLEYPQYTRPPVYRGYPVPEVLLSGNHAEIERWRRREALRRTLERRPDLLGRAQLTPEEEEYLRVLRKRLG